MQLSPQAQQRYDAIVAGHDRVLVGLDFDGVLSPIVPDPTSARIHPSAPEVLVELARQVRTVAVVTGRPAAQAVELGSLDAVADRLGDDGPEVVVMGQYGNERWSSRTRELRLPDPPKGLARFRDELAGILVEHGANGAFVEDKRIAVAIHTRRLPDPAGAFERILGPLTRAAQDCGLAAEPGRLVIEVRAPGMDKGHALHRLVGETGARGVVFAGDDLGDIAAFEAVAEMREDGLDGFLVCSGSEEQKALVELADVVVDGPEGVVGLLRRLARDAAGTVRRAVGEPG